MSIPLYQVRRSRSIPGDIDPETVGASSPHSCACYAARLLSRNAGGSGRSVVSFASGPAVADGCGIRVITTGCFDKMTFAGQGGGETIHAPAAPETGRTGTGVGE